MRLKNIIKEVNDEYEPYTNVVLNRKINSYSYDIQNQLIGVNIDTNSVVSYKYNGLSQRILKNHMGIKSQFIYNAQGQLLEEIDGATNSTRDYVYADGTLIAMIENQSNIYYIHMDHNNTPQVVTDQNKAIVWRASYAAFGRATLLKEDIKLNLRADGQYQDDETGLYYNWHRYYDPDLGRYISSDPLGLAAGINTYIYVNGNPINYTDPTGLETYQCTMPLHALKEMGGETAYKYKDKTYMFHQYSCITRNDKTECGGQDRADNAPSWKTTAGFNVPSKPSVDHMNPSGGQCNKTQADNNCFENCMKDQWVKPRPVYNLYNSFGGVNCQKYDRDVNSICKNTCGL